MTDRACTVCLNLLPEGDFYLVAPKTGRRDGTCKTCRKEMVRAYRAANSGRISAQRHEHYRVNAERLRAKTRSYYEADPEAWRARRRAEHARHAERDNTYMQRWRQANKARVNAHSAARRARHRNAPVVEIIDRAEIIARDRAICHLCGEACRMEDIHLDHLVPLSRGGEHTARNIAVAHATCNRRRNSGRLPAQLRLIG